MKNNFLGILLISGHALATDLSQSFPPGRGTLYRLEVQGQSLPIDVSIYVASSSKERVSIEYFLSSRESLIPVEMWQQFEIAPSLAAPAKITRGFIQTKELQNPEILTPEYMSGFDGVRVNDFLFSSEAELGKNKVGEETVEVPAGKTKATHYRTTRDDQTIDYWISDEAKPIGLVKLVSTSKEEKKNYKLALTSLMKNVKPFIDPAKGVPLTDMGKSFLAKPGSVK